MPELRGFAEVRYNVEVNGKRRPLSVERRDGRIVVTSPERQWAVDLVQAGPHAISLLLERTPGIVESHELLAATDPVSGRSVFTIRAVPVLAGVNAPRRWGSRDEGSAGAAPQRLVAPMPGKIVRVLARPGDPVHARQPIVVIEAMKMENELRAAHEGTITELLVREGQSVEPGALLAIVAPR